MEKRKVIIAIVMFIFSLIFSIFVLTIVIFVLSFEGNYEIENPTEQEYLKEHLAEEIKIEIPEDAEITKIEFKPLPDQSNYSVTFKDSETEKTVKNSIDWGNDRIEIDQYMKENGKDTSNKVRIIIGILKIFQIVLPTICFAYIIKVLANNNKKYKEG